MGYVIIFWIILAGIFMIQMGTIIYYLKTETHPKNWGEYSDEVTSKAVVIVHALKTRAIKKHIITNSAEKYDSKKTLSKYKKFLGSKLMNNMMSMNEENYHG